MLTSIYNRLASLNFGLWLIGGVMVLLAVGSFDKRGAETGINDLSLFRWLAEAPGAVSWWLWGAIGLLALLALNTVLCCIDSIRGRYGKTRFLSIIAPHAMHIGFLLIMLAHLMSAREGEKQIMPVREGAMITLVDGTVLGISNIRATIGPMGYPTDYSAEIRTVGTSGQRVQTIAPNRPFFHDGVGFYLKEVALRPYPAALVEVHHEPGAGLALAGALLFTLGNVLVLALRRGRPLSAGPVAEGGDAVGEDQQ